MSVPLIRRLGRVDYLETQSAMQQFTRNRGADRQDEIWLLEHDPVYTQGTSCNDIPRLNKQPIPLVKSDRGGQITYHGPGQQIIYLLLNIKRLKLGPKSLVNKVEQVIIDLLAAYGVVADRRAGAPGVYVDQQKIAALGLRIRNGCCYHGLSLNVDMDLTPYAAIDPCGYAGLEVTSLAKLGVNTSLQEVANELSGRLAATLSL